MRETEKRIQEYQKILPHMKEKVAAVLVLAIMSTVILTSVTFAWLSLSQNPEVTGVSTTVAANGNLEIALSPGDGSEPAESAVGDSNLPNAERNITWGNLVNLSDASYGLSNLILRPAQLNTSSLLESPLYGAMYDSDGRIVRLTSNFRFAAWQMPTAGLDGRFAVSDNLGVRAISSTTYDKSSAAAQKEELVGEVEGKNLNAAAQYVKLTENEDYMDSLATFMGIFMYNKFLGNKNCAAKDVTNIYHLYRDFADVYVAEADALAALLNLQVYALTGEAGKYVAADVLDETVINDTVLKQQGLVLSDIKTFQNDYKTVIEGRDKLAELSAQGGSISWAGSGIDAVVEDLANVNSCTLDGTPISSIGMSNATKYLDGNVHEAVVTNGLLYNFELRTGAQIRVEGLDVTVALGMGVTANISTSAAKSKNFFLFNNDLNVTRTMLKLDELEEVAADTYGMAIDLWVRTNAEGSFLTLSGNVLTRTVREPAVGHDAEGNEVPLYTLTLTVEEETTEGETEEQGETTTQEGTTEEGGLEDILGSGETEYTVDLYYDEEAGCWRRASGHAEFPEEDMQGQEPVRKYNEREETSADPDNIRI